MIDPEELVAYFEELATSHKEIKHTPETIAFLHGEVEELLNDIAGLGTQEYSLLFENGRGSLFGANEDTMFDRPELAIIVCAPVPDNDKARQAEVESNSKRIAFEVLGRMKKHRNEGNPLLQDLDLGSVTYEKVFGFGNNHFGYGLRFNLLGTIAVTDTPDQWD